MRQKGTWIQNTKSYRKKKDEKSQLYPTFPEVETYMTLLWQWISLECSNNDVQSELLTVANSMVASNNASPDTKPFHENYEIIWNFLLLLINELVWSYSILAWRDKKAWE